MKKKYIIGLGAVIAIGLAVSAYLLFTGPHMEHQENLRTFEKSEMLPPPHSVTVEVPPELPAMGDTNPLKNTPENFNRGRVYYNYYCVFCHGEYHDGNGPVGKSYIPKPSNLMADSIKRMQDAELVENMLTGIGHTPVLESVVPYKYWWYLSLYVKNIKGGESSELKDDYKHPIQ